MSNGYTMGYYAPAVKKVTNPIRSAILSPILSMPASAPLPGSKYATPTTVTSSRYPSGYGGYGVKAPTPTYVAPTTTPKTTTSQPIVAGAGVVTGGVTGGGGIETGGGGGGGYTPYQFQMPEIDMESIWNLAGQMADMEINPQLEELDRYLRDAGYTAEESNTAINQAYPLMKREIQKSIFENQVTAQQNLAGAGTLRGGAIGELGARGMEREAVGIEGLQTERQRQLETIRKRLGTITENVGQQRVGLEARRGSLKNVYAENMRQRAFDEAIQKAQIAENIRQFNEQMALQYAQMQADLSAGGGGGAGVTGYTPTQTGYTYPSADQIYKSYIEAGYSPAAAGNLMAEQGLMSPTGARQTAQSVATSLYPETYAWWLKQPTVQPWSNIRGKAYGY